MHKEESRRAVYGVHTHVNANRPEEHGAHKNDTCEAAENHIRSIIRSLGYFREPRVRRGCGLET